MKTVEISKEFYDLCENNDISSCLQNILPIIEGTILSETYIAVIGDKESVVIPFYRKRRKRSCRSGVVSSSSRDTVTGRIANNLRSRLSLAIKNNVKKGSSVRDLGCSIAEFKAYLEQRFYPNSDSGEDMSWDNYGRKGWHIDHIKPLSSFDLTDRKEIIKACHYTNLQPMWAEENWRKGNNCE